ncbi:MAG: hypothetical protein ACXW4M_01000 [Anaerolineales bacterium]
MRGEETGASDIDLLVELKPSEARPMLGWSESIRLEKELEQTLGCDLDLIRKGDLIRAANPISSGIG